MEITLKNGERAKLPIADKYCKENVIIAVDIPYYAYDTIEDEEPEFDLFMQNKITKIHNTRLTSIAPRVFYSNLALESVSFPNLITVNSLALANTNITKVYLPKCETVANAGFQQSQKLEEISLPSIKELQTAAFSACSKLKRIYLGENINLIYAQTFTNVKTLEEVIIDAKEAISLQNTNAFTGCEKALVYVRDEFVDKYKTATNWSVYADKIKPLSEYTGGKWYE